MSQGNQRNEGCESPIYLENLESSRDFKGSLLTKGHFPPGATSLSLVGLFFHVPNFFLRLQFIAFSLLKESTHYMFAVETGSSSHAGPWRLREGRRSGKSPRPLGILRQVDLLGLTAQASSPWPRHATTLSRSRYSTRRLGSTGRWLMIS